MIKYTMTGGWKVNGALQGYISINAIENKSEMGHKTNKVEGHLSFKSNKNFDTF